MNHTEFVATPFTLPAQVGLTIGTLDIVDSGTLTDLELAISFEGSQTGSLCALRFTLISPTGTPVILAGGGCTGVGSVAGQTLFETILDDEATTSINAGVPPYIGPHQPHDSLSAFDGESITGTWRLVVLNQETWGEGDITAWSLFVETDGSPPATPIADQQLDVVAFSLAQNYPNPFNPTTEIRFDLPEAAHVQFVLYDVMGREVARLVDQPLGAGTHAVTLDASGLPSGLYLYRLTSGAFTKTKVMTLLK